MIQVDTGGHPHVPLIQNGSTSWHFLYGFWVPNFRGGFEALNDVFLMQVANRCRRNVLGHSKCVLLARPFQMAIEHPKKIVCKSNVPGKLMYQLTTSGPTNPFGISSSRVRFWDF
jgi:hypothetical protein